MTHPEMALILVAERQRDLLAQAEAERGLRFARRQRKARAAARHADVVAMPTSLDSPKAVPAARRAA